MRIIRSVSALAVGALALGVANVKDVHAADAFVAVTAIVEHPALDACRDGIKDELAAAGYREGANLKWSFESAQGNPATAAQIARKLVGEKPDVIVPISTPSAQAVVAATKDIPVVFTAVTDPLGAKLVSNMDKPGGNVTGMSDLSPIAKHLDLIKELVPKATRVGVPYNPGEANSVKLIELLQTHAPAKGLNIVTASAPKSADVQAAARSLVGKADVIYVPTDNTIVSALEAIVKVGIDNRIPVVAGDTASVPRGAAAALGFNYYDVGRQTGKIVVRILKGEAPGTIPVEGVEITELHVNPGAAKRMGLNLPQSVIDRAKKVVQ